MEKYFDEMKLYFQRFTNLNEEDWKYIKSKYEFKEFRRNEFLTVQGFVENRTYFILEGIIRLHLDDADKNLTIDIRCPGQYISSFSSLSGRIPSKFNLQAVTDCKVLTTTHQQLSEIYANNLAGANVGRAIVEHNFIEIEELFVKRLSLTSTELYLEFIKNKKSHLHLIPLNYIASYLGITPQALSRIRKNLKP